MAVDPHIMGSDYFDVENPPKNSAEQKEYEYTIDILMMDADAINVSSDPSKFRPRNETLEKIYDTNEPALSIKTEVKNWFNENQINYKYSVYFGIMYFKTEEDKVKFILRWL